MFPAEVEQSDPAFLFSSPTAKKRSFCDLFSAMVFILLCFFLGIPLSKRAPKHSAQVLSRVLNTRRPWGLLGEYTHIR